MQMTLKAKRTKEGQFPSKCQDQIDSETQLLLSVPIWCTNINFQVGQGCNSEYGGNRYTIRSLQAVWGIYFSPICV